VEHVVTALFLRTMAAFAIVMLVLMAAGVLERMP
jgi:hypothetical protein